VRAVTRQRQRRGPLAVRVLSFLNFFLACRSSVFSMSGGCDVGDSIGWLDRWSELFNYVVLR
jgi:hypothetical protein